MGGSDQIDYNRGTQLDRDSRRPDTWLCELLQETATESCRNSRRAAFTPLELASQAGLIATAVADTVCGFNRSPIPVNL